ncbi:hypothetical protein SNE40_022792 [Patella caerulea]|uniref:Reelin domain-containing protein n=1 Tax=Patella caerulea TaxID=87958 RepID=A0AAN8J406_PATCE
MEVTLFAPGFFLFLCTLVFTINAYPHGAPKSACVNQLPVHKNIMAQTTTPPYSIRVSGTTYKANQSLTVTISGSFQGFLLQARTSGGTTPIGTFSGPPTDTKIVQCSAKDDSWTHANNNIKNHSSVLWNPPSVDVGDITFLATVANGHDIYWLNVRSDALTATSGSTGTTISTTTVLVVLFRFLVV